MNVSGLDKATVKAVAQREGLLAGPVEKALHLVALLEEIGRDDYVRTRLALKGGTALNLFHGPMRRLSVDADFDYIGRIDREGMLKEHDRLLDRLEEAGTNLGFSPEREIDAHAAAIITFRYDGPFGGVGTVKLDVNFLNRLPVLGKVEWKTSVFGAGGDRVPVPCLSANEVAGFKLGTLCIRAAPRDLFDVSRFNSLPLDKHVVRKVALFRGFLEALDLSLFSPTRAREVTQESLENRVGALLIIGESVDRDSLLRTANNWLGELLPLQPQEARFQASLLKGVVDPSLLFGRHKIHERLSEHPALQRRLTVKKRAN